MAGLMSVLAPAAALGALTLAGSSAPRVESTPVSVPQAAATPTPSPPPPPPPPPEPVAVPVPTAITAEPASPAVTATASTAAKEADQSTGARPGSPARGGESTVLTSLRGLVAAEPAAAARTLRINALVPARKRLLGE